LRAASDAENCGGTAGSTEGDMVLQTNTKPCGSELARDGGVSTDINTGWTDAIASKLAPTFDLF